MIGILDYGMGNLMSVVNSLSFLHLEHKVVQDSSEISGLTHLIIPGVGAFPKAIKNLIDKGFLEEIKMFAESGKPILGICLGMQLLADKGTEVEDCQGLGLIDGVVRVMKPDNLRIPHIGWNSYKKVNDHPILNGVKESADVYFVHSYHFEVSNKENIVAATDYGLSFISIVSNTRGNVIGTQFHPEKSQKQGLRMLKNFSEMQQC